MRISILGLPGSGKSYLARAIAEQQHIPHIHIDRFWLEAGGRQGSHDTHNVDHVRAHVREKVLEAIQADAWVSDGVYSRVQPEIANRADILIFLDIPPWRRLLNHAWRIITRDQRHEEITFWDDIRFFLEIIRRDRQHKSEKIREFLKEYRDKTVVLRSRKEINTYLQSLIRNAV